MKQQIIHVGKLQAAKVAAALYLVLSIPLVLIMEFAPANAGRGFGWGMSIVVVTIYVLFGAVFSFLGAWIYNGVAKLIGGVEFTVVEVDRN